MVASRDYTEPVTPLGSVTSLAAAGYGGIKINLVPEWAGGDCAVADTDINVRLAPGPDGKRTIQVAPERYGVALAQHCRRELGLVGEYAAAPLAAALAAHLQAEIYPGPGPVAFVMKRERTAAVGVPDRLSPEEQAYTAVRVLAEVFLAPVPAVIEAAVGPTVVQTSSPLVREFGNHFATAFLAPLTEVSHGA